MPLLRAGPLVLSAGVVFASPFLCAADLHLRAVEGQGMVVAPGAASSRRIVVAVEDIHGRPLAGATVRFRLPAEGPSGRFSSGMTSESVVSGPDGRASVYGIAWNGQPGQLVVAVGCTLGTDTAELEIPVEISQHSVKDRGASNPGRMPSTGSGRKWLILGAVIAGGAALGAATAFSHGSTPAAPVVLGSISVASVAPTVGQPSISVGPQH
ncbi:MAG: hypothetical protein ACLQBJ_12360 [Bryobacteraceae bacterium]